MVKIHHYLVPETPETPPPPFRNLNPKYMTKFLQRLQLVLWAVAIILALVFQFSSLGGELSGDSALSTFILNMVGVVLLLVAGYFVLAQRRHRLVRLIAVNIAIFCTEALFFMMDPKGQTQMYCFLIALLLSIIAYPIRDPKKDKPAEEVPADETPVEEVTHEEVTTSAEEPAPAAQEPVVEIPAEVED